MLETMKRILTMAGKYRHKVTIGIIISLLHSFFSAMDLFAILYISFSINTLTQQKIGVAAAILLVGLTGKIICKYQITEHIANQLLQIHISTGELWSSIDCRIALCKTRNDISYLCYVPFCGFSCLLTDGWTCLQYCSATNCRYCS